MLNRSVCSSSELSASELDHTQFLKNSILDQIDNLNDWQETALAMLCHNNNNQSSKSLNETCDEELIPQIEDCLD